MNKRGHVFELHVEQEWAHLIISQCRDRQLSAEKLRCQRLPTYDHCSPRRALARRENVQRPLTTRIDRVELRLNHFVDELRESSPWLPAKYFADLVRTT